MPNSKAPSDKYNASAYPDGTAYLAMRNIRMEKIQKVIAELNELAEKRGYVIANKVFLKEIGGEDDAEG